MKKYQFKYYPTICEQIEKRIINLGKKCCFSYRPQRIERMNCRDLNNYELCCHIRWMIREIQKMNDSNKRGRWIGWIIARVEIMELICPDEVFLLVREDVNNGGI